MEPKLTILFILIGCILTLSHLSDGSFRRLRRQMAYWNRRRFVLSNRHR